MLRRTSSISVLLLTLTGVLLVSILACSTDSASEAVACIELAKKCIRDDECCTGKCMWQSDGAYCQQKSAPDPPCSKGNEGCTQDRHCCGNSCISGSCTQSDAEKSSSSSGSSGTSCNPDGAECTSPSTCCSRTCGEDPATKKIVCVEPELPGPTGGCGKLADPCTLPAQCCSNNCVVGHCQN